jgi:hypothetical protein
MSTWLRFMNSPANWLGLLLAIALVGLNVAGLVGSPLLAVFGYAVGVGLGLLWFGWPRAPLSLADTLQFGDEGDTRTVMMQALTGIRAVVSQRQPPRFQPPVQGAVLQLCDQLEQLLVQWESSQGQLSLQDQFHARHLAIRYLPQALQSYLAMPAEFASTRPLAHGLTAQQILVQTLQDMQAKVSQLADDLANQDAHAFVSHSHFLHQKFGPAARGPMLHPDVPTLPAGTPSHEPPRKE